MDQNGNVLKLTSSFCSMVFKITNAQIHLDKLILVLLLLSAVFVVIFHFFLCMISSTTLAFALGLVTALCDLALHYVLSLRYMQISRNQINHFSNIMRNDLNATCQSMEQIFSITSFLKCV